MPILTKGTTFADGDQVTSTKLNNLVDSAAFVAGNGGSTDNSTMQVSGAGVLAVKVINTANIADSSVVTSKIADSAVITAKIASGAVTNSILATDAVTTVKIQDNAVTNAKMADSAVDTAELADGAVEASKMSGSQTGSAPAFATRAWAKLNPYVGSVKTGAYKTGTYSRTATETTISGMTDHGLKANDVIRLDFTSGSATDGLYTVTSAPSTSSFVVAHSGSVTSGNVTAQFIKIQASGNVSSATWYDSGDDFFVVNFAVEMPNENYMTFGFGHRWPGVISPELGEYTNGATQLNTKYQAYFYQQYANRFVSVGVIV